MNADHFPECAPDVRLDIEQTPRPLEDSSFDFILMKHVLVHVMQVDFETAEALQVYDPLWWPSVVLQANRNI